MEITQIIDTGFDGSEGILAVVIKYEQLFTAQSPVEFVTSGDNPLQLAVMTRTKGEVVEAHSHNLIPRSISETQEVLFIQEGIVKVDIFNSHRQYVSSVSLGKNDTILLMRGGHAITMLTDAIFIEVKQGPYLGKMDKVRFGDLTIGASDGNI